MLCDKNKCTGCFACYNKCPQNAIFMKEDECGYIYPHIDNQKCIECKLCERVCPGLNESKYNKTIQCYAARVKDEKTLNQSTSGGIATILSEEILRNNGIVYGAAYTEKCNVNHIRVDNINDLNKLQGSKYVHSYINNTYRLVKNDLLNNKLVLFIGTPCQVDGLKNFLGKDYDKLYLLDIICHGVPSQRFLKDEVNRLINTIDVDRVNFRDKNFENFTFSINKGKSIIYSQSWGKSPYFYTFMKSITYRENCYSCKYAREERCSDITIGDFWGLNENSKFYKTQNKGVSVVLSITEKGKKLIENIFDKVEIEEREVHEAIEGNDQLRAPAQKSEQVIKFKDNYIKNGNFFKTYRSVCAKNYYKQILKSNKLIKKMLEIRNEVRNGKK